MKNKILCIQISNNLINGKQDLTDVMQLYYDTLYKVKAKDGYIKPSGFWEIPLWITEIDHNIKTDIHICKDVKDTINFINNSDYTYICFSVLDVNAEIIKYIVKQCNKTEYRRFRQFIIGGYADLTYFKNSNNTHVFKTIKAFIEYLGVEYKQGCSYRLFRGVKTIPRLTLSTGCLYNCDFCTIENKITKIPTHIIEQQVKAFKPLKFKLVYINDKTFGQSTNYKLLPRIYKAIKEYNKEFKGFIIQTTTGQILKIPDKFIKDAHIKYIELGLESWNDSILKKYHKPSSEILCIQAFEKIEDLGCILNDVDVKVIPNIIIGIPEENNSTYERTLDFLKAYKFVISHLNIYNLAIYENTALSKRIKYNNSDKNELSVDKSFHKNKNAHKQFYNDIHKFGINILRGK